MAKRMTNTQFVHNLMEFSRHGALMQMFVMAAIEKYGELVQTGDLSGMGGGFISPDAWRSTGAEALDRLNKHFGLDKPQRDPGAAFQPRNNIEDVIARLPEAGGNLLTIAAEIHAQKVELARARNRETEKLALLRAAALVAVRQHYVDSEVETADVMVTRGV